MKRCPQCNRVETDEVLKFCRVDGATLVVESASLVDEAGTTQLGSVLDATEVHTSILPGNTQATVNVTSEVQATAVLSDRQTSENTPVLPKRKYLPVLVALVGFLAVAAIVGGYFYEGTKKAAPIETIAVMPFVNEGNNPDVEYLSDGMTETLISSLSQLPNLNVKPRSTVFRYKGKNTNLETIGKELNVQAVLIGRVIQRGQDVSLFVELIDVALDKVVWSQQYNRRQTDLVALQSDIARDVSNRLRNKLSGPDEARVTKTYTTNPEAYQLYLKGNFYLSKYTEESCYKAMEFYQKALELDPNYALAYFGMAAAYDFTNDWYLPPKEAAPKAKAAAIKALALDDSLAEAHFLLGKIVFWYDWDWSAAEREWKRAHELDPTYPATYPPYLSSVGRHDESIRIQESLLSKAPLDLNMHMDLACILLQAGQTDRSIEQTRKALEIDPNFWWAHQNLGLAYERKRQYAEAIATLEKAHSVDSSAWSLAYLGAVYGLTGNVTQARRVIEELKEMSKTRHVSPYNFAIVYSGLNDRDQAFAWLDRAYEARSIGMTLIKVETVLENLRSDPRFDDLLRRMNLPQ